MERPVLRLTPASASWPAALREIESPPEQLWLRGAVDLLARGPKVAIVGARAPTPYGEAQARRFALELAAGGAVIVSGLARGVDHVAHEAALEAGGATIGVLGCGVDRPWPSGPLSERMVRDGLLASEFEPGSPPLRRNFPLRNRVISGLCEAVVVIEAAAASGSLITARWAADQGRTVFALPGRVDHPMARGCHRLIREGALLVETPEEVLADLGLRAAAGCDASPSARTDAPRSDSGADWSAESRSDSRSDPRARWPARSTARSTADSQAAAGKELADLPARVLRALRGETLSADELAERLHADVAQVLTWLVELELAGNVVRGAGGLYRLA